MNHTGEIQTYRNTDKAKKKHKLTTARAYSLSFKYAIARLENAT